MNGIFSSDGAGNPTLPGKPKFKDLSGPDGYPDGKIDEYDRTVIGRTTPRLQGGFANFPEYEAMYQTMNAGQTRWNPAGLNKDVTMSYFVEDGSFLRCNDISLGYSLPDKIIRKAGMSKCRFYASVTNPFIITNYSGYDPEVDVQSGLTPSYDYNRYPRSRSYVLGLNLSF